MPGHWPIIGHEATVALLRHGLAAGRVAHAFLLTGPPAIGKFALASAFAQALNCTGEAAPCGQCRACRLIGQNRHPDVRVIQMPDDKREIGIDQIRTVLHEASLKPYEAAWKAYIVRDAETMSEEAANCLLKTLEEPPPQVILMLTAPTPEALLPTLVSRCQPIPMHPLPISQIETALQAQFGCDPQRAGLLARLSIGHMGWAIQAAGDQTILEGRQRLLDRLAGFSRATRVDRLAFAAEQGQRYGKDMSERESVHAVLDLWSTWWRDLLLANAGCQDMMVNADRAEALQRETRRYSLAQVRAFLESLRATGQQLRQNVNPRLALEVLVLAIPRGGQ
ncbi:MAG: DNA polymerase III subunit delta' [Chloroflexota bacterium]|nr:DNA polymerase III subunit delta' [Chloroflexota bacterium]